MSAGGKRRGPRGSTLLIFALFLVLLLQGGVLLYYPHLLTGPPSRERIAVLPVAYRHGAVVHYEEELTFRFPPGEADWDDELHVYSLHGLPPPDRPGELLKTYTAQFRSGRFLEQPVEMEISFARELEAGILDPSDGIYIMYYNDLENAWEDVPAWLDRERQVAVFYAPHFTGYGMGKYPKPHPLMTLGVAERSLYTLRSLPDSVTAEWIIATHSPDYPGTQSALTGINMFSEAFDLVSVSTTTFQELFGIAGFERFNGIAGNIGLAAALIRFNLEIFEGSVSDRESRLAVASSLLTYSLGTWGTQAMNIAGIGVFAINYSLTRFGETARGERMTYWRHRYSAYNRRANPNRRSEDQWLDYMAEILLRSRNVMEDLQAGLEPYLQAFFLDEFAQANAYDDQRDSFQFRLLHFFFGGGSCPEDVRAILLQEERTRVLGMLHERVPQLRNRVLQELERGTLEQMNSARSMLNERLGITVMVFGDTVGDPRIRSLSVRIPVDRDQHLWEGQTDDSGWWCLEFTRYGYLFYGTPQTVELQFEGEILTRPITMLYGGIIADVRFDLPSADEDTLIRVTSNPPGANVFFDGRNTGMVTPAEITDFAPGTHQIRLTLEDYSEFVASFSVEAGESHALHAELEEEDGTLRISSEPSGAALYFNGTHTGMVTPAEITEFQTGTQHLRIYLEGYNEYSASFHIEEGASRSILAELGDPQPPLPVFAWSLVDGTVYTDNVVQVSGSIELRDGEGNLSPFLGSTAILTLNGADMEVAVAGGNFATSISIPSGRSVVSMRANSLTGDTGVSDPVTIHGDFSVPDLEVTLTWNSPTSDLDLHVYNPEGEHCYYGQNAISDGFLDIDDVNGYGPETFTVENAYPGAYLILINCFDLDDDSYSDASVRIHVQGRLYGTFGPHRFTVDDHMEGDPWAWWEVTTVTIP